MVRDMKAVLLVGVGHSLQLLQPLLWQDPAPRDRSTRVSSVADLVHAQDRHVLYREQEAQVHQRVGDGTWTIMQAYVKGDH